MTYTLAEHGDGFEQAASPAFLKRDFPAYQEYWQRYVVPLTNRPLNVQLQNDASLAAIGKGPEDVAMAQLHYTVFRQPSLCNRRRWRDIAGRRVCRLKGTRSIMGEVPNGARAVGRVLLIGPGDRLLLLLAQDGVEGHQWWVTPGGGLENGESFQQAACREVHEEAGLQVQVGPWVWTRRHVY
jgi:hypothetical protein